MLGDIMYSNNMSKESVNTINQSLRTSHLTLSEHPSLDNMIGKYSANTTINVVDLKHKFKNGVL